MKQPGFTKGKKGRRIRHIRTTVLAWCLVLVIIIIVIFVGFRVFAAIGYRNLKNNATSQRPEISFDDESGEETGFSSGAEDGRGEAAGKETGRNEAAGNQGTSSVEWKNDWVKYGDKIYDYNDDILTFLFLGIDKMGKVEKNKDLVSGGQSDAIFLVILNPDTGKISLLGVNRDTMVDVIMPGLGPDEETVTTTAQIAVQHGFGDGLEYSCELTRDAVSQLFYHLPIHGYAAFNMGGISALNDALGGVTVTIPEDMMKVNSAWKQRTEVTLKGKDAYDYIHYRDTKVFESARNRLARQKQYLSAMVAKALDGTKKDLTLPLTLYQTFKPYIVTDISADEISYLATVISRYSFDGDTIYTLEGTTVQGDKFEEFYPDQRALKELMLRLFYREVDPLTGEYIR